MGIARAMFRTLSFEAKFQYVFRRIRKIAKRRLLLSSCPYGARLSFLQMRNSLKKVPGILWYNFTGIASVNKEIHVSDSEDRAT